MSTVTRQTVEENVLAYAAVPNMTTSARLDLDVRMVEMRTDITGTFALIFRQLVSDVDVTEVLEQPFSVSFLRICSH